MKKSKILIGLLIVILTIFVVLSILVALYGKEIVESQIEQNLKMKASLGSIKLGLPLTIRLRNLEVGDLFQADKISFSPNILGLVIGKVVLSGFTLTNPVINLEQSQEGKLNLPQLEQRGKQPPVYLTGLTIKNGKFTFTDKKISSEGYKIILDKISLKVSKVAFPLTSLNTKVDLSATFLNPSGKALGSMSADGWIDFGYKDMDGTFQIKDLDVVYFSPYYGDFISQKKLLSAKLNFTSLLKAKSNDLEAKCNFLLSDLVYEKSEPRAEEPPQLNLFKDALDLFTDKEGKLSLEFSINTKLDKPAITPSDLQKAILKAAMQNISKQSPQELYEKVSDTVDQFKQFGKELKEIFKRKE
jgi:hypothetical protein